MAMPEAMPTQIDSEALAVSAPVKAAASSMPSMPMLMTPDFSHSRPARAPSASGTALNSVPWNRPRMLIESPRAAQANSATTNSTSAMPNHR
jgi:hypothetical protein